MAATAKILIAEDDAHTRQLLRELLEQVGYAVVDAADGVAAVEVALREHPDAILLDLMLPRMDGISVLGRLRADSNTQRTPVLIVTAISDMEGKMRGIEAGADDYITKPFKLFEVQARLKSALDAASVRRELRIAEDTVAALKDADPIRGAGNFAQLKPSLDYEMGRARRYGRPLACVLLGVDAAPRDAPRGGDEGAAALVRQVTEALRSCLRGPDRLFRIEDDYLALLPETDAGGAGAVAQRMVASLAPETDGAPGLRAVAGVAAYPGASITSGEDLILAATQNRDLHRAGATSPRSA